MPAKVYWKGLRLVLELARHYIQRNQLKIQENVDEHAYNCVIAVLTAVLECLSALPENTPV